MKSFFLAETDSTNKYAKEHIKEFSDKTLIYTYNQTNGRGRLNRKWSYAGEDNIYASIVLKPEVCIGEIYSNLTQYLCVVLCEIFEGCGVRPKIKWPNDILINSKKISGILAEGVLKTGVNLNRTALHDEKTELKAGENSDQADLHNKKGELKSETGSYSEKTVLDGLVLGFGVNLNADKDFLRSINQPATALNIETGGFIDKEIFLKKFSDRFCLMYDRFVREGFPLIRSEYLKRAEFLNKEVTVRLFDREICGIAEDVTENGALKLRDYNNREHILLTGDIL